MSAGSSVWRDVFVALPHPFVQRSLNPRAFVFPLARRGEVLARKSSKGRLIYNIAEEGSEGCHSALPSDWVWRRRSYLPL